MLFLNLGGYHLPGVVKVLFILVSVEDGERQHPPGDHLGLFQELI